MIIKNKKYLIALGLVLGIALSLAKNFNALVCTAGSIPIQHNGRVKSLEAFSRETLRQVSGKETWKGRAALLFMLDNLDSPEKFMEVPWIRVDYPELKTLLNVSTEEKYFSYAKLAPSFQAISSLAQSAQGKRDADQRPSKLEQKAETLYGTLMTIDQLSHGEMVKVVPTSLESGWESPYLKTDARSKAFKEMMATYASGAKSDFLREAQKWVKDTDATLAESINGRVGLEVFYYRIQPFHYAWMLYLLAFLLLLFPEKRELLRFTGEMSFLMGFLFHTIGLVLRIIILARPPVSNMYESMIFMNWILVICAGIFFLINKNKYFLSTGAVTSALIMIYASLLPVDSAMEVLAPVLRSNYWLTIHVMTIVASYGILALAMALGHRHLFLDALGRFTKQTESVSAETINRLLQAGLITLGIGTVLGGVWANESWGRFWGWDPKETWALITFLGYMVVVHLRFAKKINDLVLALSAVLGFLLVLMTWYGVNFILGRGLHSYGFGAGGVHWIVYYLIFEVVFFGFVIIKKSQTPPQPLLQ
jgi:cytochrome c-type biogenesis protein CcsB